MAKKKHASLPADVNTPPAEQTGVTQPPETCGEQPSGAVDGETGETEEPDGQSAGTATAEDTAVQSSETDPGKTDEQLEENLFADRAAELFARYPHVSAFWFTSDVTAFFSENDARNHAGTLDSKSITKISR